MIIIRAMTQSTQSTQSTQPTYFKHHVGRSRESSWMLETEVNVLDFFLLVLDVEPGSILLAIYISPCDTLIRFPDKMAPMLENVSKMFFPQISHHDINTKIFTQIRLRHQYQTATKK